MKPNHPSRTCQSKWRGLATCLVLILAPCYTLSAAESPLYIPFQGQVTNQAGVLSADGQYSVIFNLYDQAVGGQPVWSERHVKIGVTRGMINVFLGSITPLTAVDFSQTKYLGITVDVDNLATTADPEMVPRSLIMPAFHAKNAEKLAGFDWSAAFTTSNPATGFLKGARIDANTINTTQVTDSAVTTVKLSDNAITTVKLTDASVTNVKLAANSVGTANIQNGAITSAKLSSDVITPPGTIVAYIGDAAPTGWMLCDGTELNRVGLGANLALVIGTRFGTAADPVNNFKLPDLRGYFLRGVDGSAGRDPDKATRTPMATGGVSGNAIGSVQPDQLKSHSHAIKLGGDGFVAGGKPQRTSGYNDNSETEFTGGAETRPKNAYVNYIIKL